MATYERYTDVQTCTYPYTCVERCNGTPFCFGPSTWGSVVNETIPYDPHREYSYRTPSKGNSGWNTAKKSGAIIMTPHEARYDSYDNYIVGRPERGKQWVRLRTWNSTTQECCDMDSWEGEWGRTHNVDYYAAVAEQIGNPERYATTDDNSLGNAVSTTKLRANKEAAYAFDLLTEIAEAEQTISFVQSGVGKAAGYLDRFRRSDVDGWRRYRSHTPKSLLRSSSKVARSWARKWLALRYALMPIIYSMKDMQSLFATRRYVYKTVRANKLVDLTEAAPLTKSGRMLYGFQEGNADVRSTVKLRYAKGSLSRFLDGVGFNPLLTLWELVPLSFVVDWFLNVSENIVAATSFDLSCQRVGCTSVKRNVSRHIHLYDDREQVSTQTYNDPCVNQTFEWSYQSTVDAPVWKHTHKSYRRHVWIVPELKLSYDPFITVERIMDGIALSAKPISKVLRRCL